MKSRRAMLIVNAGDRFGRLTVVEEAPRQRRRSGTSLRAFVLRCDCGTIKTVRLGSLTAGATVSCGCFHREMAAEVGKSSKKNTREVDLLYDVWKAMQSRCHDPANKSYGRYGARGIAVCQEWRDSFAAFLADIGERPKGMTLDRINSAGNYEPGNVRWATYTVQARNTRRNIRVQRGDEVMTLAEAAERFGIVYGRALYHINKGREYEGLRRV